MAVGGRHGAGRNTLRPLYFVASSAAVAFVANSVVRPAGDRPDELAPRWVEWVR